jgi:hypothetical protein
MAATRSSSTNKPILGHLKRKRVVSYLLIFTITVRLQKWGECVKVRQCSSVSNKNEFKFSNKHNREHGQYEATYNKTNIEFCKTSN